MAHRTHHVNWTAYRRLNDVAAQIRELAPDQWHVTLTAMQPGGWVPDEALPILDLGTFTTTKEACDAADLVLESWSWDASSGRAGRSNFEIVEVGIGVFACRYEWAARKTVSALPAPAADGDTKRSVNGLGLRQVSQSTYPNRTRGPGNLMTADK